jgi:hypothetical protein
VAPARGALILNFSGYDADNLRAAAKKLAALLGESVGERQQRHALGA